MVAGERLDLSRVRVEEQRAVRLRRVLPGHEHATERGRKPERLSGAASRIGLLRALLVATAQPARDALRPEQHVDARLRAALRVAEKTTGERGSERFDAARLRRKSER